MHAIHIAAGLDTPSDASLVEAVLRMLAGVADVVAVQSLGLISVLYDEHKVGPRTILRALRSSGYDARLVRPSTLHRHTRSLRHRR